MKKILIQLDTDVQPSAFDRVVAIDADVDHLFSYGGVTPETVEPIVHGAIFTRGPKDLSHTAIFIGGSDVAAGEALLEKVSRTFFGPMRVSVMMDSNGSNTTAAAAVLSARKHLNLQNVTALVLAGARVRVASRSHDRAAQAAAVVSKTASPSAQVTPVATGSAGDLERACLGVEVIIAAGAAGAELLPITQRKKLPLLKVAIDLNAVPPAGIAGIE